MYRPQQLAAAFLSAALLCTSGIALADKGGAKGNPHGGAPGQSGSAPGQSNNGNGQSQGASQSGPGGIGGPRSAPGPTMNGSFGPNGAMQGDVNAHGNANAGADASSRGASASSGASSNQRSGSDGAGEQAQISVKVNGVAHTFVVTPAALKALRTHGNQKNLIFFSTNGKDITAVSAVGEKMDMRVVSRSGNTFTLQSADGQARLIMLDAKTAARLHVKVGANLQLTAMSAQSGRIVAMDMIKQHGFDKFSRGMKTGVNVAKLDIDRAKADIDVARVKKAKQADVDAVQLDIDIVKADLGNSKTKNSKKLDNDVAKLDNDEHNLEASSGCGHGSSRNGNPAFANQMAKDAANDASGHNPPGLPHECVNPAGNTRGFCKSSSSESICGGGSMGGSQSSEVAQTDVDTKGGKNAKNRNSDVDVAKNDVDTAIGSGAGKCGHGSSRNGNPAFANQMAKDAANDASGHNPPGLPHECVNPAGNTRGFCKSSSSESICGNGMGAGGNVAAAANAGGSSTTRKRNRHNGESQLAANISKPCAPGTSSKGRSNPAFANQMAKDAANDASGHNPPGLPHECVNPAGHTRGFCKTGDSSGPAMCGSTGGSGVSPSELHGGIASASVPAPGNGGTALAPGTTANGTVPGRGVMPGAPINGGTTATVPVRGYTPSQGGTRGPGAPVGFIPAGGGPFTSGSGTRGATRGARPTHVLGAATGPTSGRRIAALPTRVLPVAIQPVGKRRCVWYKTGVLGASTGPHYIVGTSAIAGKPVLHKKCR